MTPSWNVPQVDEAQLARLAECIALKLRPGDMIALSGGLGAGKTTFARALVRALLDDGMAEVPSPTFSLVQTYGAARFPLAHLDLYRIGHEDEVVELGLDEIESKGVLIVEWAERAPSLGGPNRLDVRLSEERSAETREVALTGSGSWASRLQRVKSILGFLDGVSGWRSAEVRYFQGDASVRTYARLRQSNESALLMDWPRQPDGPPLRNGLSYSRIAHIAEDVSAFVGVAQILRRAGFRAPAILAADLDQGLLLTEDFGDRVYGREIAEGRDMRLLWQAAVTVLVRLRAVAGDRAAMIDLGGGRVHRVPRYDIGALTIETELLPDWYWPMTKGGAIPEETRAQLMDLWRPLLEEVGDGALQLVLRDYHSPNLIWCPDAVREATDCVGLIDFQDAVLGHPAYDLVSLLQDARLDVPADVERDMLEHYIAETMKSQPDFDADRFLRAYAILGAQRNTKILGIFARLAKRDGKSAYLAHIPRIWRYLERDFSHPTLARLEAWYDTHFPPGMRSEAPRL
jgi:tRNA threonylcarbamoyl adenosine modification protein YjeE